MLNGLLILSAVTYTSRIGSTVNAIVTGVFSQICGSVSFLATLIALWILFEDKGVDGWRAIIPVYRDYISYKLFFSTSKFWIMFVSCIALVVAFFGMLFGIAADNVTIVLVFSAILIISLIVLIVISIQFDIALCKHYGQGGLFTFGMIFFTPIFMCVLAYLVKTGKAQSVVDFEDDI